MTNRTLLSLFASVFESPQASARQQQVVRDGIQYLMGLEVPIEESLQGQSLYYKTMHDEGSPLAAGCGFARAASDC